ncbi:MAG: hypothetical protein ABEJ68_05735 [Halobacteriaceae archaeon]
MAHYDSGWQPKGVTDRVNGFVVHDHGIKPNEVNEGEIDGDVSITDDEDEAEE